MLLLCPKATQQAHKQGVYVFMCDRDSKRCSFCWGVQAAGCQSLLIKALLPVMVGSSSEFIVVLTC